MAKYGVHLMTLTEKETPSGGRMLTGRLGDAVVVGLPIDGPASDGPRRWRISVVDPLRGARPRPPQRARAAELDELAARVAGEA